jgi:urea carboxylase
MFRRVLIANRATIACRIIRTLKRMGIVSVAVYTEHDRHSLHVKQADEAVAIPSYLNSAAILAAARPSGAEAIHPGYGFLSENADFAEACAASGIVFIGPTPQQMRDFGLKHTARRIAADNGLPMLPGTGLLNGLEEALTAADRIGYPLMLKSTAGGGGIGMRLCHDATELSGAFAAVEHLAHASFGQAGMYLEKFVANARHIEVQIFGDGKGSVIALGERDCSTQRRHQKVIEETPAPNISAETRSRLCTSAVRLGEAVRYQSAGTVEFIYDADTTDFYFLEVNTRLQVEHGVTEEVTGLDLVECMVRGSIPDRRPPTPDPSLSSIQVRLYAEDPYHNFQPSSGRLTNVQWPAHARIETWVESGAEITPYYDPMIAKIIVQAPTRAEAVAKLSAALDATRLDGIETNLEYLRQIVRSQAFAAGRVTTACLRTFHYRSRAIDILSRGTQTTIQDYPGRIGYWHVGVPPSGPMDSLAFRLANAIVGNPSDGAGLEFTIRGPTLRFRSDATIALTGADFNARLDGIPVPLYTPVVVPAGATLELHAVQGPGLRGYLAIAGGLDIARYLGSAATFILGKFGGTPSHVLPYLQPTNTPPRSALTPPVLSNTWDIAVLYGPHGAPDFFTSSDIDTFFSTAWKVHHNSDRTGVRLIGPKPAWARKDGGEAGLHPSNIHDNAYAIGTIDFTGDMPVILGPDGPSLGGFVCPSTIIDAELWKIGQLKPGDTVRFHAVSLDQATAMRDALDRYVETLTGAPPTIPRDAVRERAILHESPGVVARADGDDYLLLEYGPNILDLNLRFRVHALESELRALALPGILDITPGVRSLHVHYDGGKLRRAELLDALDACERRLPDLDDIVVPSRIVHLPLSWDDPATQLAIRKYMQGVRPDAPWCPGNIEFIRRINGLASSDDVHRIVFSANYLVLGLGDVYLGAPVATPTDPRHRLVTTKYNPARTWTPENAVGIGGAYLCVYGMEGPGGYQFVGRTVQIWNTYEKGTPWHLRFFDQIRFEPVSADELLELREDRSPLRVEEQPFRLRDYHAFLRSIESEASAFKRTQQAAFEAERERWRSLPQFVAPDFDLAIRPDDAVPDGCRPLPSPVTASVWNVAVETGQRVEAGQRLIVLEAMKMEIAVSAPFAATIEKLNCSPGTLVTAGQNLVTLRQEAVI